MKRISIFLGVIFLLAACNQTDYNYKTENKILDCFYQHHKDNDIDVKASIDKVENVLLKHKILSDKTGESYIRIVEQIRDYNDLEIKNPDLLNDINTIGYIPSGVFCRDTSYSILLDSASLTNSKFKYVIGIFDSIQVKGIMSPALIAEEILEVFDAKDFENEYYRTIGLVMFSNLIKMDDYDGGGIARKLPPGLNKEQEILGEQNVFAILINAENKILVDSIPVEISELKELVKKFLLETSDKMEVDLPLIGRQKTSKGSISIQNDRGTSYEFYIGVQKELVKAYREVRNKYSMQFFNSSFEDLDNEKHKVIKDLVPQRISEAEPKT